MAMGLIRKSRGITARRPQSLHRVIVGILLQAGAAAAVAQVQQSPTTFRWILSARSAGHYADLLSGMSNSEAPCHQYLDPDNTPPAPVVIVSLDEYEVSDFRRTKAWR